MSFQQGDSRQEARTLQAIAVKAGGWHVGGEHQGSAGIDQRTEQPAEQHRIGDIVDMQFVEAQHLRFASQVRGYLLQRLWCFTECSQSCVHFLHESVEVDTTRPHWRQSAMKQVHQERLAAAYTAVEVQAGRGPRLRPFANAKARERRLPPRGSRMRFFCGRLQLLQQCVEAGYCPQLRSVGRVARRCQSSLIPRGD